MAAINALQGSIAATNAGPTKDLIDNLGIDGCTLNCSVAVADGVIDGDSYGKSIPGLYTWTITAPFKFPKAAVQHGHKPSGGAAFITQAGSGLYLAGVKEFDVTMSAPVTPDTDGDATAGETYMYADVLRASGTYTANVDSSTAMLLPGASETGTFTISDETNDGKIIIPLVATVMNVTRSRGAPTTVQYSFESNGTIQYEGDSSPFGDVDGVATNWPLPHNEGKTDLAAVTVTHATGRTAAGDAFYTSVNFNRSTGDVINGTLNMQGSGALTIA